VYELLVVGRGWSPARYGHWVAAQLAAALLEERAMMTPTHPQ
jgi:hypothetical protein